MKTSGAMVAGLLAMACGPDAGGSAPSKPDKCNPEVECIGSYLSHRERQSGNCEATHDQVLVLDGKDSPQEPGCTTLSELTSANGCKTSGEQSCTNGTHVTIALEQQDADCNTITGIETVDLPGTCSGTLRIVLTRQ